jgi:dTDP-4-dehydrorhamnose 3,5-epimerase
MIFSETFLKGAYVIDVNRLEDERGFFGRSFCRNEFQQYGLNLDIYQSSISYNKYKGTLRGLHMQIAPFEESKLIRCCRGAIYDVIVDLRKNSDTYTKWVATELNADKYRMLYVPEGFAHGFITLEDNTELEYHISQLYTPGSSVGYLWSDPTFNIEWPIPPIYISAKDQMNPLFEK